MAQSAKACDRNRGYTLLEALVVMAVLLILLALSLPSLQYSLQRSRLRAAADRLRSELGEARTLSLQRNRFVYVSFDRSSDGSRWCWGLSLDTGCNCSSNDPRAVGFCAIDLDAASGQWLPRRTLSSEFPGVTLAALPYGGLLRFSPVRPELVSGNASFVATASGDSIRLLSSALGRLRLCSPTTPPFTGLPAC